MFGLIVSDPQQDLHRRDALAALLHSLDIPLTGFTADDTALFTADMSRGAFLRRASAALLQPGQPLPLEGLMTHLTGSDPLPGNVVRRYVFLQLSLLPWLRPGRRVTQGDGYFLLGDALLVAPVHADDTVDVQLPQGVWTELTGACWQGRLRQMRGYNEQPVLVRENTLLPIGVCDRRTDHDDADRVTLHWFQPGEQAACTLADGTRYAVRMEGGQSSVEADTDKAFHLIVHQDGTQTLVR